MKKFAIACLLGFGMLAVSGCGGEAEKKPADAAGAPAADHATTPAPAGADTPKPAEGK